jgi:hypothetical protein
MSKRKGQTTIYKIVHGKLKIKQHEPHKSMRVNWGVLYG